MVLREGRKREVRRLWESQGLRVSRLIRIRYGNILLPRDKQPGKWWEIDGREVERLWRDVESCELRAAEG